ncbi:MAG: hypothetical protein R2939_08910 [Kofleriaceae bacterium]
MIRTRTIWATLVAASLFVVGVADTHAQPAPTPAELEQAKTLYAEGKALYDAKQLTEAVAKFRDSYRLSKNPLLLFNIAITLEENGQKETALNFYRKFLADAPADAAQRPQAQASVAALEAALLDDLGTGPTQPPVDKPPVDKPADPPPTTKPKIKPPGTYAPTEFQHQLVEEAPPGKPLDLTAYAPEDSGWQVTLYFRAVGDDKFTARLMKPRYKELVGRIPAAKMTGSSVQYYVDVKDQTGELVTRVGKPSSPNVVFLDAAASARFYPDWSDDAGAIDAPADGGTRPATPDDEDPLGTRPTGDRTPPVGPGTGLTEAGSSKFTYAKWGTTAGGAALLSLSLVFYLRASNAASTLEGEAELSGSENCPEGNPCREFDDFLYDAEGSGKSAETWSKITFGAGVAVAGVAGYLWYREWKHKRERRSTPGKTTASTRPGRTWAAVPALTDGGLGAAALVTF